MEEMKTKAFVIIEEPTNKQYKKEFWYPIMREIKNPEPKKSLSLY